MCCSVGMLLLFHTHVSTYVSIQLGTKVRVYTQVGKTNQGKFALDVAVKSLELYKE
jgi:hypothetical protein